MILNLFKYFRPDSFRLQSPRCFEDIKLIFSDMPILSQFSFQQLTIEFKTILYRIGLKHKFNISKRRNSIPCTVVPSLKRLQHNRQKLRAYLR